ncbi:hypothetical protein ACJ41O_013286 [Fusarium nematophilum]
MKWTLRLVGLAALSAASITVQIADVKPIPLSPDGAAQSPDALFRHSCPEEAENASLVVSSFSATDRTMFPSSDGLIRGAIEAWTQHQHLQLRPDEVWFEILAQLNSYVAAHAEDLRNLFVDHSGTEEIRIGDFSWAQVVRAFGDEIQKRVKTGWLLDWVMPGFSTSTSDDEVTAAVLMMGLMQHYFEFSGIVVCGIPSVTLLGERDDWVKLQDKLQRLGEFGEEPARYADILRPILRRFVQTWDDPESEDTTSFWSQIVRAKKKFSCGAGAVEWDVSGWITGFMHFTRSGSPRIPADEDIYETKQTVTLDGVIYVPESLEDITVGYARAPLKMVDYPTPGTDTMAYLLAGNVGVEKWEDENGKATTRPWSGWFMYVPEDYNRTAAVLGNRMELEDIADGIETCKRVADEIDGEL